MLAVLILNSRGGRAGRIWTWALLPILVVSVISATVQAAGSLAQRSRKLALTSYLKPTFEQEGLFNYVDDRLRVIKVRVPHLRFPPESVRADRTAILVRAEPGQVVDSNIRSAPEFVHISGAKIIGVDLEANDVLEIGAGAGVTPRAKGTYGHAPAPITRITVSAADSFPIVAGRLLTGLALLTLAVELVLLAMPSAARGRIRQLLHRRHA